MNRWLFLAAVAGSLLGGCTEDQTSEDTRGSDDTVLQQVASGAGGKLGASCMAASDCSGKNARCLTTVPVVNISFPQGFCTSTCKADRECGTNGACPLGPIVDLAKLFAPDAGALAAEASTCYLKCKSASDCREGYSCAAMPASPLSPAKANPPKFCLPPIPDGGFSIPDGGFTLPPGLAGLRDAGAR